jgi:hydrogenase-4 component F
MTSRDGQRNSAAISPKRRGPKADLRLAGSLRSTAVLVLLRFYQVVARTDVQPFAQKLLIFAGLLSLGVAAIYIWRNRNYKRLLAYSSVEHLGIIALGVGIGGVALLGALLHLLFNSFGKAALFFMAGNIHRSYNSREIEAVTDLLPRLPWSAFVWALAFLYIVGTPPFGIFFSGLFVLRGMIHSANWLSLVIFLALLTLIFIGMSRAVLRMLHTPSGGSAGEMSTSAREPRQAKREVGCKRHLTRLGGCAFVTTARWNRSSEKASDPVDWNS